MAQEQDQIFVKKLQKLRQYNRAYRILTLLIWNLTFLSAFAKLRKATNGIVMSVRPSVRPSVRMKQLGSHWKGFHEILYLSNFRKTVQKIQVSLKSDKNNGYFIREMFQTKVVEEIKTHILCSVTIFFRKLYRLWDNVGKKIYSGAGHRWQYGACALQYVILIAFLLQQWFQSAPQCYV